tara:strand:- start:369 stop:935 length:567 start_codon:yes stop_codon:yes gene_type:complete
MKYILTIICLCSIALPNDTPYANEADSFQNEPEYIPIYDFSLSMLNDTTGSEIKLSDFKGSVVLLNFWATWCGPCIVEIPEFNELYKKYKDQGFEILGVSVSDTKQQLEKFQKKFDVDYKILYSSPEIMNDVNRNYGVNSVPLSYLINRDGFVVRGYPSAIIGEYWTSALTADINKFLESPSPKTPYK